MAVAFGQGCAVVDTLGDGGWAGGKVRGWTATHACGACGRGRVAWGSVCGALASAAPNPHVAACVMQGSNELLCGLVPAVSPSLSVVTCALFLSSSTLQFVFVSDERRWSSTLPRHGVVRAGPSRPSLSVLLVSTRRWRCLSRWTWMTRPTWLVSAACRPCRPFTFTALGRWCTSSLAPTRRS